MIRNQRLTICFVLGLLGAGVAAFQGLLTHRLTTTEAYARFDSEMPSIAAQTAAKLVIAELPTTRDKAKNQLVLDKLNADDPRIAFAALVDPLYQVSVSSSSKNETPGEDAESEFDRASADAIPPELSLTDIVKRVTPIGFPHLGEYYQPVFRHEGPAWGQLRLVWNQRPLHDALRRNFQRTVLLVAITFFLVSVLTYWLYGSVVLGSIERMADAIDHILSDRTCARLEPSILSLDLLPLVTQINRVLEGHEHDRKRAILLEEQLGQAETSYNDFRGRTTRQRETIEHEKEMALVAFHEIFGNTTDGIVVADHNGEVGAANRSARRWLGLRDSTEEMIKDESLLALIRQLTRENGEERAQTGAWTYRDTVDGQSRQARVYARLLDRHEGGRGVVLLHIFPERSRRGGGGGTLERLYARFVEEVVQPVIAAGLSGDVALKGELRAPEFANLALWAGRMSQLRAIDASVATGRSRVTPIERFDLGAWLSKQLEAPDLFADKLSVRLYSPEVHAMVAVAPPLLELAFDGLVAFLHEAAPPDKRSKKKIKPQSDADLDPIEWVVRLERDTQDRAEVIFSPTSEFKLASLSHLNVLREATDTPRPGTVPYAERLTCRQEIALVSFLTAHTLVGGALRVQPADRKNPPVIHWVFPNPEQPSGTPPIARRLRPKSGGMNSMLERFFSG